MLQPADIISLVRKQKTALLDILLVILGNLILAIGVACFILPQNILTGGVAGIAVALYPLFHIQEQVMIYALTVLLFLLGSMFLGKAFLWKTLLSTVCYPLFLYLLTALCSSLNICDDALLSSIYGGACMGIGVGLVFRCNASTGGMDIPPLIINKYTNIPLSFLVLITDGFTVCFGAAIYGIKAALIGILSVWISSYMINRMMVLGTQQAKKILIISEEYEQILTIIHKQLERGATLLEGVGTYSRQRKPVIMVCVTHRQYIQLSHLISGIDDQAFIIVEEANEVKGFGFSFLEERMLE